MQLLILVALDSIKFRWSDTKSYVCFSFMYVLFLLYSRNRRQLNTNFRQKGTPEFKTELHLFKPPPKMSSHLFMGDNKTGIKHVKYYFSGRWKWIDTSSRTNVWTIVLIGISYEIFFSMLFLFVCRDNYPHFFRPELSGKK